MTSASMKKKVLFLFGAAAVAGMATLAGCSAKESDTVPPSSGAPSAEPTAPTEKAVIPSGGNSFSPSVKAKPAPTALPGGNQIG